MGRYFLRFCFLFLILVGLGACQTDQGLTPTPPVPVFGNFVMGVAVSKGSNSSPEIPAASLSTSPPSLRESARFTPSSLDFGGLQITNTRQIVSQISFHRDPVVPPNQDPSSGDPIKAKENDSKVKEAQVSQEVQSPDVVQRDESLSTEIQFPGPFVVQLIKDGEVAPQSFPDFGVGTIPFGTYHSFEMKFETLQSSLIPPELLEDLIVTELLPNQSLVVEGSFTFSPSVPSPLPVVTEIPLLIISDQSASIRVSSTKPLEVSADKVNYFFITFRINRWFGGLLPLLQNITVADLTKGTLVISKDHPNPLVRQILSLFEQNLDRAFKSAPSEDAVFQETDVDEASSSVLF